MTSEIILCIVIVFFTVYSSCLDSVITGSGDGICYENVSRPISQGFSSFDIDQDPKKGSISLLENERTWVTASTEYDAEWVMEKLCCQGYEEISEICTPQCSTTCEHGDCVQPNTCECKDTWGGNSCNETLFCVAVQSVYVNVSESVSELPVQEGSEDVADNPAFELEGLPECQPGCLDEVDSVAANCTQSENVTYCLFPIDSPCNTIADYWIFSKEYSCVIGGVGGIILLFLTVLCIVCIVKRKRRTMNRTDSLVPLLLDGHLDPEYDYVDLRRFNDQKLLPPTCK